MADLLPWINFFMASVALTFSSIALIATGVRPPWMTLESLARRLAEFSASQTRPRPARTPAEPIFRTARREPTVVVVEAAPPAPAILEQPRPSMPIRRVDPPEPSAVAGPKLIDVPNLAATEPAEESASLELRRRFGDIWDFADQGMSQDEIARMSGYPIGQVELILGLRRKLILGETRTTRR